MSDSEAVSIAGGWIPADPMEKCAVCGRKERHMTTKREGWEAETTGDEGQYDLICPDCQNPDPKNRDPEPCRSLADFTGGGGGE